MRCPVLKMSTTRALGMSMAVGWFYWFRFHGAGFVFMMPVDGVHGAADRRAHGSWKTVEDQPDRAGVSRRP
jgi:hypothetical protein